MGEELEIRKAERTKLKVKVGVSGLPNSGKTIGALKIAYGLCGDWNKVVVISSEPNKSADIYAHDLCQDDEHQYSIIDLVEGRDYSPEMYVKALRKAEEGNFEVVVIDSISHAWGEILESVDRAKKATEEAGGKVWGKEWMVEGARHKIFIHELMTSNLHVIMTCRQTEDVRMVDDGKGKQKRKTVGLKDVTKENWGHDLTLHFIIDAETHEVTASVDRSHLFLDKEGLPFSFKIDESTGQKIKEWANIGIDKASEKNNALYNISKEEDGMMLGILYDAMTPSMRKNSEVQQALRKKAIDVVDLAHTGKELADGYKHIPDFLKEDGDLKKAILNAAVELIPNHKAIVDLAQFWIDMCGAVYFVENAKRINNEPKEIAPLPFVKGDTRFYGNMRLQQQSIVKWSEIKNAEELATTFKLLPCKAEASEMADIKKRASELMRECTSATQLESTVLSLIGNNQGTVAVSIPFLREDKEFTGSIKVILEEIKSRPPAPIDDLPDFGEAIAQEKKAEVKEPKKKVGKKNEKK